MCVFMDIERFHCLFASLSGCRDDGGNGLTKTYLIKHLEVTFVCWKCTVTSLSPSCLGHEDNIYVQGPPGLTLYLFDYTVGPTGSIRAHYYDTLASGTYGFSGQATSLPRAFIARCLYDPTTSAWNMDTGDEHSIPVTNTGHSIFLTPIRPLHLNNVLITPHIVKNLIFVRQFVRDNNCTIEFDAFGFFVKDFMTRRVLLRCDSTGDLYPVTPPSPIPHAFFVSQYTWHQRLRHPGDDVLGRLVSSNFISYNKEKPPVLCHACQLGKHVRLLFVSSSTVISFCFNIIHSDVWTSPILSLQILSVLDGSWEQIPIPTHLITPIKNAEFFENNLIDQEASESLEDLEIIQKEDTNPFVDTSLGHDEDDQEINEPQSDINPIRKSTRTRRAPDRMCLYVDAEEHELGDLGEPANYKAALLDP
nr:ribonuclease H-like domain-containing protein [Tanacetum cinerariifolium]